MKQISVLGLGYIGLPTAIVLAKAGFEVTGFDTNAARIRELQAGRVPIDEPGVFEAFERAVSSGALRFSAELLPADVFVIAVPTPFLDAGDGAKRADLSFVDSAAASIAAVLRPGNLVILESTVPPRSTRRVEERLAQKSGLPKDAFLTAHCPERIIPGNMLAELTGNDRIVGGTTEEASLAAKAVYDRMLSTGVCRLTDDLTAELCKLTENTYRDVNIAFANELSLLCDKLDVDVFELVTLANCHPRVNILSPGVGVGGHCIAVDPWFLVEQFPEETAVIHASRRQNDAKPSFVCQKALSLTDKPAPTIAVLGLAYKANVSDLRQSPSIELCRLLAAKGAAVLGVEPNVPEGEVEGVSNVSLEEALRAADAVVITLSHREFIERRDDIAQKPCFDAVGLLTRSQEP